MSCVVIVIVFYIPFELGLFFFGESFYPSAHQMEALILKCTCCNKDTTSRKTCIDCLVKVQALVMTAL